MPRIDCFGTTHIGKRRSVNQDQFLVAELKKTMEVLHSSLPDDLPRGGDRHEASGWLLTVADGMGGHAAGDLASRLVLETATLSMQSLIPWFVYDDEEGEKALAEDAERVLDRCRARLARDEIRHPEHQGMGTTLTVAYLVWPRAYIMHIGDSRCYAIGAGVMTQVTTDHTFAQQLVEQGTLTPEQARESTWAHTLWNVVSGRLDAPQPEFHRLDLQSCDALLLCSDGLTKHVDDAEIAEILASAGSAEQCCRTLVDRTLSRGASDNVTVAVVRFNTTEEERRPPETGDFQEIRPAKPRGMSDTQPLDL